MSNLKELYREVIVDHTKSPRNYHELEQNNRMAEGYNPLCGDRVTIYLLMEEGVIKDISFIGSGCAISTASASLMTEELKGMTEAEAQILFKKFHVLVTETPEEENDLGKLDVLAGVREFPARVKCATLAWHTLLSALKQEDSTVSTE